MKGLPPSNSMFQCVAIKCLVEFSRAIASTKHPISLGTIASVMYGLQVLPTAPDPSHGGVPVIVLIGRQ